MEKVHEIFRVPKQLISRIHEGDNELPEYRTEFMRDRYRLMYATAFRRLAGKTQIYTVGKDDHKKNRLTHTLEVSQIARTIALALGLDADLAEAIALGHDFGHTPFGHAGEEMLNKIMLPNSTYIKGSPFYKKSEKCIRERFEREHGDKKDSLDCIFGFKHNIQSVRVAAKLENSYQDDTGENIGLNLTNFTLYGMMIHSRLKYNKDDKFPNYQNMFAAHNHMAGCNMFAWSFEAYVVKWADDIAQWHHDLEDAMREKVLPIARICKTIRDAFGEKLTEVDAIKLKRIEGIEIDRKTIAELSHIVVNTLVNDLIETSRNNFANLKIKLDEAGITSAVDFFKQYGADEMKATRESVIGLSDEIDTDNFKGIIRGSIHHSQNVERMNEKGKYIIRKLFEAYFAHPQQLPDGPILHFIVETGHMGDCKNIEDASKKGVGEARIKFEKVMENPKIYEQCVLMRRICDHIASMTDHYAIEEYNKLYG